MSTRLSLRKRAAETSSTPVCPSSPSMFKHFKIETNVTEEKSQKNIKMMNELPQISVAEENLVKSLFNAKNETKVDLGDQDDKYLDDDNLEYLNVDKPVSITKENCNTITPVFQDISHQLTSKHDEKSSTPNNGVIVNSERSGSIVSINIEYEDYLVHNDINKSENISKENYDTNKTVLQNETAVVERDMFNGKGTVIKSTEERFSPEKLDACGVIKQDNLKNEDKVEKVIIFFFNKNSFQIISEKKKLKKEIFIWGSVGKKKKILKDLDS